MSKDDKTVFVTSYNQSGGITAQTVNVHSAPPKRILKPFLLEMTEELKKYPPATYRMHYSTTDTESFNLANELDSFLASANWERINPIQRLGGPSLPSGITLFMLRAENPGVALANILWQALGNKGVESQILQGIDNVFKVHGWEAIDLRPDRQGVVIFVGPQPEQ